MWKSTNVIGYACIIQCQRAVLLDFSSLIPASNNCAIMILSEGSSGICEDAECPVPIPTLGDERFSYEIKQSGESIRVRDRVISAFNPTSIQSAQSVSGTGLRRLG